ncbi:MAG: ABC transporter ATP-binding protein [Rhodobacteraceae bacterium]|nr:MAG: ABC transporter ATP-binding protein [Paracoccaceae bacterium]
MRHRDSTAAAASAHRHGAGPQSGHSAHVRVSDLSHAYRRGGPLALGGVDLEVRPGEIAALVGRSGCGKSTLLHLIAGLATPTAGAVHINGARVTGPSPRWVMMFQAPSLFPWMTVAQNAALGLRFTRRAHLVAERIPRLLRLVDLAALADRNAQELSGGQQQRVALARSLATEPDLLLLDEPFSALDAFTRRALQADVRRIAGELGLTVILVTHDVGEAVAMADRAFVMAADPGRVVCETALAPASREPGTPAFEAERTRLATLYETHAARRDAA